MRHQCKFCKQFITEKQCLEHSPIWDGQMWKKYGWCSHGLSDWEDLTCPQEPLLRFTIDLFGDCDDWRF